MTAITVGYTQSDWNLGYSSFSDGYREGADQQTIAFWAPDRALMTPEDWAEAVYTASNSPEGFAEGTLYLHIFRALAPFKLRSVSVGDTMSVDGVRLACDKIGWVRL